MHASTAPPRRLLGDLRALPGPFWILFTGMFINRLGSFVWPFLTIYLTRQGYSLAQASAAVGTLGVGSMLGGVVGGWLTDRFGRRHTISIGSALAACSVLALFCSHGLPSALACIVCWGMASGTYNPAASALLADIIPEPLRVRAYSAYRLAINAGFACGMCLGGLLANYSFKLLFAGDAATTLAFSAIAAVFLPHGLRRQTSKSPWRLSTGDRQRDRAILVLLIAAFLSTLAYMQFATTFPMQIIHLGVTITLFGHVFPAETAYGLLAGWNGLLVTVFELPLTSWTQRWRSGRAMSAGQLLLGLGLGMNLLMLHFGGFLLAMTIFTLGEMISSPVTQAALSTYSPKAMRGRIMGLSQLSYASASVPAPYLGAMLFQISPTLLWGACAVIGIVCAVLVFPLGNTEIEVTEF